MEVKNFFNNLPDASNAEQFETLLENKSFKLERIVSLGQATPEGEWVDQDRDEWVMLLKGRAGLLFEGETVIELKEGDYVKIPAHHRHRVEWTDGESETVWLALHFSNQSF